MSLEEQEQGLSQQPDTRGEKYTEEAATEAPIGKGYADEVDVYSPKAYELDVYDAVQAFAKAQATALNDRSVLQPWLDRYPKFQTELKAASCQVWAQGPAWLTAGTVDSAEEDAEMIEEDAEMIAAGQAVLASLLPQKTLEPPITSLVAAAKAKGLSIPALAAALHLDIPLLARLEQRLIRAATLPRTLVEQMAKLLDRSTSEVSAYLRSGPILAAGAHYKAQQAPRVNSQADFADALKTSSPDVRAHWTSTSSTENLLGEDKFEGEDDIK